jgi:hypothetical protein
MFDSGAVIFDRTESRQKQGRAFLTLVRASVFEFVAGVPRRRTGAVDFACEFHCHPRTPPLPAHGGRCYNLTVNRSRCVIWNLSQRSSVSKNGGMVQGSARQVLNLKTRVRFPVPLPNSLP